MLKQIFTLQNLSAFVIFITIVATMFSFAMLCIVDLDVDPVKLQILWENILIISFGCMVASILFLGKYLQ